MNEKEKRRWINLGEIIALAALIVSAVGVWIAWKSTSEDKPTRVVEQRQPIPLTLRGRAQDGGRELVITPVEPSHALESLTVSIAPSGTVIEVGADGVLSSHAVETGLNIVGERDKRPHSLPVGIDARYVEMGKDRHAGGKYVLRYRWEGGGLLGGRSLRLVALSR